MKENKYSVEILSGTREFTAREKLKIKDFASHERITENSVGLIFAPCDYAITHVINDKSETGEYDIIVILTADGTLYSCGSPSFMEQFQNIFDEMINENEPYEIKVMKMESKNHPGKFFLTCTII